MSDARIRVSRLSFAWPDGTPVLDGLDFTLGPGRTGLVAPNGAGKSTLLKLLAGELHAQAGMIDVQGTLAYLPQQLPAHAGHASATSVAHALGIAERLAALDAILAGSGSDADFECLDGDWDLRERATATLARLGLGELPLQRDLASFSGGEAMWLALAARLLRRPDVLLLDEPSNHLDSAARARLRQVLAEFGGCLLVASHDRALLDAMDQIAELRPTQLRLHGGGGSFYREALEIEQQAAEQRVRQLRGEVRREQRERQQSRERAERRAGNASRNVADAGLPRLVAGKRARAAQVSAGKAEQTHADRLGQAQAQLRAAAQALDAAVLHDFAAPASRVPGDRVLFHGEGLQLLQQGRALFTAPGIDLTVRGPERIALGGANGAGKSSLLRVLSGERPPDAGRVRRAPGRVAFLDQQLNLLEPTRSVADNFARFAPALAPLERANLLARLGFRGERQALPVAALSGGERLRATLACVLRAEPAPQLLLLDEPTNNLDLDSVAQLEQAIREYTGALVVVSHDVDFLEAIGVSRALTLVEGRLREAV